MPKEKIQENMKARYWSVNDFIEFLPARNWFSIKIILRATFTNFATGIVLATVSQAASSLQCDLNLTALEVTLISVIFFLGESLGSFYFGRASDTCGRKLSLMASTGLMVYFILLSAASPSLNFFLIMRLFVGAGYGGNILMKFIYCTEFMKAKDRGLATLIFMLFFTAGTLFSILMSYLTLNRYGWRIYMAVSSIIGGVFGLPLLYLLPESMRFLHLHGKTIEIKKILNEIATTNNIVWPSYALLSHICCKQNDKGLSYIYKNYKFKIMVTSIVFMTIMLNFYGLPFLILYKLKHSDHCDLSLGNQSASKCSALTDTEVLHSLYINSGTIPGAFISYVMADKLGRKVMMNVSLVLIMLCYLAQIFCLPQFIGNGLLFMCSGLALGSSSYIYMYTSELFPTNVRATGSGIVSGFGKMTCLITPFIFQQLFHKHPTLVLVGMSCMSFVSLACLCFLPETLNKDIG